MSAKHTLERKADKHMKAVFGVMAGVNVRVPRHQQALRSYLLVQWVGRQRIADRTSSVLCAAFPRASVKAAAPVVILTAPVVVIGIFTATLVALQPSAPVSAQWFAVSAARRVGHMDPGELARLNAEYQADLRQCLDDAIQSKTLRIVSANQVKTWAGQRVHEHDIAASETFLTYTNTKWQRIIIALNGNNEPVIVMNIDATPIKEELTL